MAREVSGRVGQLSKKLTALTLETYGLKCWLQFPGCTQRATTKDHIIPKEQGGTDDVTNLRPACKHCNSSRQDLSIGGTGGIDVTIYVGALPTLTHQRATAEARPGDLVLSSIGIHAALSPSEPAPASWQIAQATFKAAMRSTLRTRQQSHIRIAHPTPTAKQLITWTRLRYSVATVDPGRAEAEAAAALLPRYEQLELLSWYDHYSQGGLSIERTIARGIGKVETVHKSEETAPPSRDW